ncbi:MAG: hypothetical protein IJ213_03295 [Bacteroidales bacterium]|nr:hypothetical protein [Bacteroidales bacterium]
MKKIVVLLSLSLVLLSPAFAQKKNPSKKAPEKREISKQDPKEIERMNALKAQTGKSPEEMRAEYEEQTQRKYEIFRKELHLEGREMDEFWSRYKEYSDNLYRIDEEYMRLRDDIYRENFGEDRKAYDELKMDSRGAEKLLRTSMDVDMKKAEMKRQFTEELLKSLRPEVVLKYMTVEARVDKRSMRKDLRQDQPAMRDLPNERPVIRKK